MNNLIWRVCFFCFVFVYKLHSMSICHRVVRKRLKTVDEGCPRTNRFTFWSFGFVSSKQNTISRGQNNLHLRTAKFIQIQRHICIPNAIRFSFGFWWQFISIYEQKLNTLCVAAKLPHLIQIYVDICELPSFWANPKSMRMYCNGEYTRIHTAIHTDRERSVLNNRTFQQFTFAGLIVCICFSRRQIFFRSPFGLIPLL